MELLPAAYSFFVRPKWFTKHFISSRLQTAFDFSERFVLEFGCGIGSNSCMFDPGNYLGVDIDVRRIRYAASRFPDYRFHDVDGPQIPIPDSSADVILIVSVLHHIPTDQIGRYLCEFRRVLRPCGEIVVLEPCLYQRSCLCNLMMKCLDRGKYLLDEYSYISLFEQNGFSARVINRFSQLMFYRKLLFKAYIRQPVTVL